jgi:hypothetical protein
LRGLPELKMPPPGVVQFMLQPVELCAEEEEEKRARKKRALISSSICADEQRRLEGVVDQRSEPLGGGRRGGHKVRKVR